MSFWLNTCPFKYCQNSSHLARRSSRAYKTRAVPNFPPKYPQRRPQSVSNDGPPEQPLWPPKLLYADRGLIVIDKPPGLVSQPIQRSLAHNRIKDRHPKTNFGYVLDDIRDSLSLQELPRPIHRLDKPTTGVLALARTQLAASRFSQQLQKRYAEKIYYAIVRGGEKSFPARNGTITDQLYEKDGIISTHKNGLGRDASTGWELIASSPKAPLSLIRLRLYTGIKHQLRAHLAYCLQTPILGDIRHSSKKHASIIDEVGIVPTNRLFLHASYVSFLRYRRIGSHKQFRLGIQAPIPLDFRQLCDQFELPIPQEALDGGIFIDGKSVGNVDELDGFWISQDLASDSEPKKSNSNKSKIVKPVLNFETKSALYKSSIVHVAKSS